MDYWNHREGQFARERKDEDWVVDEDLLDMAKSGQYGYEQMEELELNKKQKTYQSYDQDKKREDAPILNEGKDSYDAIETDSQEELKDRRGGAGNSTDPGDEPLTKKIVIELIICILAFVGRGLCLNSLGPTLIDLRQIASLSIPQGAWIFLTQSIGDIIGSLAAKHIFQEINNEFALSMCLFSQAIFTALIPAFPSAAIMCIMLVCQGLSIGVVGTGVPSTCVRIGGKNRNGMFLQAAYVGVSIGSVMGTFVARPFLSDLAKLRDNHQEENPSKMMYETTTSVIQGKDMAINITNQVVTNFTDLYNVTTGLPDTMFTKTHVYFYYVIMGLVLSIPAISFLVLFFKNGSNIRNTKLDASQSESLTVTDCTAPLSIALGLIFMQCLVHFGMQDTYSNLLTTFAVLGPLHFTKTNGVYLSGLFWGSMCFGQLNGIWLAKLISPFKMLLMDMLAAGIATTALMLFANKFSGVLWGFTILLGLSFATINGATVSWATSILPGNNYIIPMIMVGRVSGLLILPPTVTVLFKAIGAMTLMYGVFLAVCIMLATLIIVQLIATKFRVDGKLQSNSEMRKLKEESEDGNGL